MPFMGWAFGFGVGVDADVIVIMRGWGVFDTAALLYVWVDKPCPLPHLRCPLPREGLIEVVSGGLTQRARRAQRKNEETAECGRGQTPIKRSARMGSGRRI